VRYQNKIASLPILGAHDGMHYPGEHSPGLQHRSVCCVAGGEGCGGGGGNGAVDAVMREAGLNSSSDSQDEFSAALPSNTQTAESIERPRKRSRRLKGPGQGVVPHPDLAGEAGQADEEDRKSKTPIVSEGLEGEDLDFDYKAARAAAPGLDLGLTGQADRQGQGQLCLLLLLVCPHCLLRDYLWPKV
jgi:hypothetical protein